MITDIKLTRGDLPTGINVADIALEASVSNDRATAVIAASWYLVEAYTGKLFWSATAGVALAMTDADATDLQWPRFPYPDDVTVEKLTNGVWATDPTADYVADFGIAFTFAAGWYRLTQSGTVDPIDPAPNVLEAVRALALYQLIHSPARREFRSIQAGDSTLTREALAGLFKASGAGILLASEAKW